MDISNYNIEQCDAVSVLNAIMDMHDHPQKIDQIAAAISPIASAAAAYSEGKPQLAQAITAKGVTTAADASLATMAANIRSIHQETITIDGGEMYAKQLYGVKDNGIVPGYWNLYEVMAYLLSKTSTEQYSILLCEIPKGDAEYTFSTAVTPGSTPIGYVFSDDWQLNGEGSLYIHDATEASHAWNDDLNMKGNRWVAWLFAQVLEGATAPTVSLGAAATNCPQPRSIHIGRHMGAITATANGVLSEIVVTDGNQLDDFNPSTFTHAFGKKLVFRNFNNNSYNLPATTFESVYVDANAYSLRRWPTNRATSYIIKVNSISGGSGDGYGVITSADGCPATVIIQTETITAGSTNASVIAGLNQNTNLKELRLLGVEEMSGIQIIHLNNDNRNYVANFTKLYIGYKNNDKSRSVAFRERYHILTDVELQDGWCKPLDINECTSLTKANVQDHIFDRLGVNDSGTTVTIHLATAVYDLFTAEEIAAVTTRTSITIARG